jgi:flagellar protein FliT
MDEQQVLATYEHIARLTGQMLAAAQASQWDRLTALEQECSALFAPLMAQPERPAPASADYVSRKSELIRHILADDAQIRLLVEPRLEDLAALLSTGRQQRQLNRAYQRDA